jgi:hypothetical protein
MTFLLLVKAMGIKSDREEKWLEEGVPVKGVTETGATVALRVDASGKLIITR